MIGAIVTGTLVGDPVERQTREGKPFVTATARVAAATKKRRSAEGGEE